MTASRYTHCVPLAATPGWVIDNDASVREEVAPYVNATMAERWAATRQCSRAAITMLGFHKDRARALEYQDPLPESSQRALARLRKERA